LDTFEGRRRRDVCDQQPKRMAAAAADERCHEMNWDQIQGNWKQIQGKAREKWGDLTDDDMAMIGDRKDQLVGQIQAKYGKAKDDAEREIDEWASSLKEEDYAA
jgi:uncharacterized protein YjbJ (UPF0337 family)